MRLHGIEQRATGCPVSRESARAAARKRHPPLPAAEGRDPGRCSRQLQAIAEALTRSTWQGSPAVLVNVAQVHEVLAGIYNRTESHRLGGAGAKSSEMPQDASKEGAASGGSSGPP